MYKIYFKQAIQMLKQNKFISIISIAGTALAIMMIMTLIVVNEVKNISIAPEDKRDRTLYITFQVERERVNESSFNTRSGDVSPNIFNKYLSDLKTPEYISIMSDFNPEFKQTVNVEGESNYFQFPRRIVDASYWNIFSFDFIDGNPFSEEDFQSDVRNVVLSESIARELFKGEKAVGRTIQINFENHRVTGVVKDVSTVFKYASGGIWVSRRSHGAVLLVARDKQDFPTIIAEVREAERRYGIENEPWFLYFRGPENQKVNNMDNMWRGNNEEEFRNVIKIENRRRIFLFAVLLIIPALNLSGFSLSRIKKRTSEIGVRKAFGAKKHTILIQVLYENLITSLIGGFIGLIFSYIAVVWLKNWLLGVTDSSTIPLNAFLSPAIFVIVFAVCVLLNLLSAGLSALKASRMSIVNSLNKNDQL
ncbi:MAG: ABC transporter permease [Dysgonamonadaceae bacterium]|jgi:putative ABC transport system permease protein|nr:ABC transporter permease [Dysgonamonadaceae bacterium]